MSLERAHASWSQRNFQEAEQIFRASIDDNPIIEPLLCLQLQLDQARGTLGARVVRNGRQGRIRFPVLRSGNRGREEQTTGTGKPPILINP